MRHFRTAGVYGLAMIANTKTWRPCAAHLYVSWQPLPPSQASADLCARSVYNLPCTTHDRTAFFSGAARPSLFSQMYYMYSRIRYLVRVFGMVCRVRLYLSCDEWLPVLRSSARGAVLAVPSGLDARCVRSHRLGLGPPPSSHLARGTCRPCFALALCFSSRPVHVRCVLTPSPHHASSTRDFFLPPLI